MERHTDEEIYSPAEMNYLAQHLDIILSARGISNGSEDAKEVKRLLIESFRNGDRNPAAISGLSDMPSTIAAHLIGKGPASQE